MPLKTVLIYSDHGLMLAYFLDTGLAKMLTDEGVHLVFLVQAELVDRLRREYVHFENIEFISSREDATDHYRKTFHGGFQEIIEYVRGASMSHKIPLSYVDIHRRRKEYEARGALENLPHLTSSFDLVTPSLQNCQKSPREFSKSNLHHKFV